MTTDYLFHALAVPEATRSRSRQTGRQNISAQGVLNNDSGAVQEISSDPDTQTVTAVYAGRFADLSVAEIKELATNSTIGAVPLSGVQSQTPLDGYYAPEQARVTPKSAQSRALLDVRLTARRKGTRRSHWRAVRTNPQDADNPFGAGAPEVGLSVQARKVRWFDDVGGGLEDATPQRRVEGEHGQLDIYDASEPAFDSPVLIYDIPYELEYPTDCVVWDTYDRPKVYQETTDAEYQVGSATVGDATVTASVTTEVASQWQRVYVTDHDWRGDIVLETDRLRLTIDQPEDTLRAYRWADGQYNLVQLGASDWRLFDIDLTTVGLARIEAQFEFENQADGSRSNLNATLVRGLDDVVWTEPVNEDSTPQGLIDRLAPIATAADALAPTGDVVRRGDVDR